MLTGRWAEGRRPEHWPELEVEEADPVQGVRHPRGGRFRHQGAVTVRRVGFQAEDADLPVRADELDQPLQLGLCLVGGEVEFQTDRCLAECR